MNRVLIAEDQAMVRGALASLLALEDDIEVVGEVERGDLVVDAARTSAPAATLPPASPPRGTRRGAVRPPRARSGS